MRLLLNFLVRIPWISALGRWSVWRSRILAGPRQAPRSCSLSYFISAIAFAAGGLKDPQHDLGFHYWHEPGAFADGFRGVAKVVVFCSTFSAGCKSIVVAGT